MAGISIKSIKLRKGKKGSHRFSIKNIPNQLPIATGGILYRSVLFLFFVFLTFLLHTNSINKSVPEKSEQEKMRELHRTDRTGALLVLDTSPASSI